MLVLAMQFSKGDADPSRRIEASNANPRELVLRTLAVWGAGEPA